MRKPPTRLFDVSKPITASVEPQSNVSKLRWWGFSQNNSGGYFITNDVVAEEVFIQAASAKEARARAQDLFEAYSDFCECCGERWYIDVEESDGTSSPMIYDESIYTKVPGFYRTECRLHYWDGKVETYVFGTDPQKTIS